MAFVPVPDDIALDGPTSSAAPTGPKFTPVPDNVKLDSTAPAADAPSLDHGALRNFLTSLARVPGVIAGAPHAVAVDLPNWLTAKTSNLVTGGSMTGADVQREVDRHSLIPDPSHVLPTAQGVDNAVFGGLSALAGRKVEPYEPTTTAGKIGGAAVTALAGGALDPVADFAAIPRVASAIKSAIAGGAAEGAHILYPDSEVLPIAAAVAAHGASTAGARAGRAAGSVALDTGRQIFAPTRAGEREAARTLSGVDHSDPTAALAQPTPGQLRAAATRTSDAVDAIGSGVAPYQAGASIRANLANREAGLKLARKTATAPIKEARDASTANVDLDPVISVINGKLSYAAGSQADALNGALKDLHMPSGAMRMQADQLAASRQAISARINAAKRANDDASVLHLMDVRHALDRQITGAVPEAAEFNRVFGDMSRPLDVFDGKKNTVSAVPDAIERDRFGGFNGTPPSEIPDSFLRGNGTKEKLDSLIEAYGGDRNAALAGLEQHLVGKVQSALRPDGTLDAAGFDKAFAPYRKGLAGNAAMYFPSLSRKFDTAKAAQATLERVQSQRSLADGVTAGALRDDSGAITGRSFGQWLRQNEKALADTQSPAAVLRLHQIANALKAPEGQLADAIKTEILPAAAGVAMGGAEGGFLGATLRHATHAAFGGLDAKRQAAFNAALERAALDPNHAAKLTAEVGKRTRYMSPAQALVQSIAATIPAAGAAR